MSSLALLFQMSERAGEPFIFIVAGVKLFHSATCVVYLFLTAPPASPSPNLSDFRAGQRGKVLDMLDSVENDQQTQLFRPQTLANFLIVMSKNGCWQEIFSMW